MTKDKYIGFDMACKKTIACVVQQGEKDAYCTLNTDVQQMQKYLQNLREDGSKLLQKFTQFVLHDCFCPSLSRLPIQNLPQSPRLDSKAIRTYTLAVRLPSTITRATHTADRTTDFSR